MLKPGIWRETLKNVKNEKHTLQYLDCGENIEKRGKCDTHSVGPGIWRETVKKCKKGEMQNVGHGIWREN